MIASVGRANEVGLLEYHFTLIRAMLTDYRFLMFVLIAWLFYGLKCDQFMVRKLQGRNYAFISVLNTKSDSFVFTRMFQVQLVFFLPVILYAAICIWIGVVHRWYANAIVIALFILIVCLSGAWRFERLIRKNGQMQSVPLLKTGFLFPKGLYLRFVLQYIGARLKMILLAVKTFSCFIMFGMLIHRTAEESDWRMFFLFYSFSLMGHGVLIYKIRQTEEISLRFYRNLPVSLPARMIPYLALYFILLIPEIIIIALMTPIHLNYSSALLLIFFGWSLLILLNSLLFIQLYNPFTYLKILTVIYLMVFFTMLTGLIIPFTVSIFLISIYLFSQGYYRFEMAE
jgi:hypothetical protein